jgi:5-methylcytosine-specific restriction endonuclease McrA
MTEPRKSRRSSAPSAPPPADAMTPKQRKDRRYYERHRERVLARVKAHDEANREAKNEYLRKYYVENRDHLNEADRARRERNIETVREKDRIRCRNPARRRWHYLTQQAPRRTGVIGRITPAEWEAILELYGRKCLACGVGEGEGRLQIDHVIPVAKGGRTTVDNVQPLCGKCNRKKGTKSTDYRPAHVS